RNIKFETSFARVRSRRHRQTLAERARIAGKPHRDGRRGGHRVRARADESRRSHAKSRCVAMLGLVALANSGEALAHHGLGRFDRSQQVAFTGVITGIDFVNPHSYLHFDVVNAAGKKIAMSCEMRAATLLRRSGWAPE